MAKRLENKKIAILVTKGFEQIEFEEPVKALHDEGAEAILVSPAEGEVTAWQKDHWGENFEIDMSLREASPDDFDALFLPAAS